MNNHEGTSNPFDFKHKLWLAISTLHSVSLFSKMHSSLNFFVSLHTQQGPSFLGLASPEGTWTGWLELIRNKYEAEL